MGKNLESSKGKFSELISFIFHNIKETRKKGKFRKEIFEKLKECLFSGRFTKVNFLAFSACKILQVLNLLYCVHLYYFQKKLRLIPFFLFRDLWAPYIV